MLAADLPAAYHYAARTNDLPMGGLRIDERLRPSVEPWRARSV